MKRDDLSPEVEAFLRAGKRADEETFPSDLEIARVRYRLGQRAWQRSSESLLRGRARVAVTLLGVGLGVGVVLAAGGAGWFSAPDPRASLRAEEFEKSPVTRTLVGGISSARKRAVDGVAKRTRAREWPTTNDASFPEGYSPLPARRAEARSREGVDARLPGSWLRVDAALASGDLLAARTELERVARSAVPEERESALLARAKLELTRGSPEVARPSLESLARRAHSKDLREEARRLLESLEPPPAERSRSVVPGTHSP